MRSAPRTSIETKMKDSMKLCFIAEQAVKRVVREIKEADDMSRVCLCALS